MIETVSYDYQSDIFSWVIDVSHWICGRNLRTGSLITMWARLPKVLGLNVAFPASLFPRWTWAFQQWPSAVTSWMSAMTLAVPTSIAVMQNSDGASTLSALTLSGVWALSPMWQVGILKASTCEQGVSFLFSQTNVARLLCSKRPSKLTTLYRTLNNARRAKERCRTLHC